MGRTATNSCATSGYYCPIPMYVEKMLVEDELELFRSQYGTPLGDELATNADRFAREIGIVPGDEYILCDVGERPGVIDLIYQFIPSPERLLEPLRIDGDEGGEPPSYPPIQIPGISNQVHEGAVTDPDARSEALTMSTLITGGLLARQRSS